MKNLTKKEIELLAIQTSETLQDGNSDVLELYIESKKKAYFEECLQKQLKSAAHDEATLHGTGEHSLYGARISVVNSGNRLQYGDDVVIKELKAAIKERESLVKTATNSVGLVFDLDGVQVEKVPVTYGGEILKTSF